MTYRAPAKAQRMTSAVRAAAIEFPESDESLTSEPTADRSTRRTGRRLCSTPRPGAERPGRRRRHSRRHRGCGRDRAAPPRSVRRLAGARISPRRRRRGPRRKTPEHIEALRRALEALARVLSGPAVTRYRIASTSQSGVEYLITADGADVTCSCPGFEYRGQCRHARDVKSALAAGSAVPAAYVPVAV